MLRWCRCSWNGKIFVCNVCNKGILCIIFFTSQRIIKSFIIIMQWTCSISNINYKITITNLGMVILLSSILLCTTTLWPLVLRQWNILSILLAHLVWFLAKGSGVASCGSVSWCSSLFFVLAFNTHFINNIWLRQLKVFPYHHLRQQWCYSLMKDWRKEKNWWIPISNSPFQ